MNTEVNPDYDASPQDAGDDIELLVPPEVNNENLRQIQLAIQSAGFNLENLHTGANQRVYSISAQADADHADYPQSEMVERKNRQPVGLRNDI